MSGLCIIPCGKKKIWDIQPLKGPVPAEEAYLSPFHRLCKEYALHFGYDWVALSAKHGYVRPDDRVDGPYDVTFSNPGLDVITMEELRQQVQKKRLNSYTDILVLGGKKYRSPVLSSFADNRAIQFPLEGYKGLGYIQQALRKAIDDQEPLK